MNKIKYKAVFVHSHIFLYDKDNNVYSEGKLTYGTWKRYLNHFAFLTVLGRYANIKDSSSYNLSSGDNVEHVKMESLSVISKRKLNLKRTKEVLRNNIKETDVVIARLPSSYGFLAIQIAKKERKPYVVELVGDPFSALWFHGKILGKLLAPFSYFKTKRILKNAPYVLYVTNNYLQKRYPTKKTRVITSCSNVEIENNSITENKTSVQNERFTIGLIGSYTSKYKGIDNALNVLKVLLDEGKDIELRILGSGDPYWIINKAKELGIGNYVKLYEALPAGPDVLNWLRNLDLYIQPSLTEGLPRALIEAMSCELPCVASNVGGIPELLTDSTLHSPKDEKKMYEIIKKMYENNDFRKSQAKINYKVSQKYTKDILDKKRYIFWENTLNDIRRNKL